MRGSATRWRVAVIFAIAIIVIGFGDIWGKLNGFTDWRADQWTCTYQDKNSICVVELWGCRYNYGMSDILQRLASLGVTKGFPATPKPAPRASDEGLTRLRDAFPDAVVRENCYGPVFKLRRVFPLSTVHGVQSFGAPFEPSAGLDCLLGEPVRVTKEAVVAMDTETSGLTFDSAAFVFMIGLSYFTTEGLTVDQLILPDLAHEEAFLEEIRAIVSRFELLVTYNGKAFDVPMIQSREKMLFLPGAFDAIRHVDLLMTMRRFWKKRLYRCRLRDVEEEVLKFYRSDEEIAGSMAPDIYRAFLADGTLDLMGRVAYHNCMDVASLSAFLLMLSEIGASLCDDATLEERYLLDAFAYRNRLILDDPTAAEVDFLIAPGRYSDGQLSRMAQVLQRAGRSEAAVAIYRYMARDGNIEAGLKASRLMTRVGALRESLALLEELAARTAADTTIGQWSKLQKTEKINKEIDKLKKKIGDRL